MTQDIITEVAGIFESKEHLGDAIRELEMKFPQTSITVMASQSALEDEIGQSTVDPKAAIDDEDVPRRSTVKPEESTILKGAVTGGATYAGGVITAMALSAGAVSIPVTFAAASAVGLASGGAAAVLTNLIGDKFTDEMDEQIEAGGLLLWVNTPSQEDQKIALNIMTEQGAKYVEVHEVKA